MFICKFWKQTLQGSGVMGLPAPSSAGNFLAASYTVFTRVGQKVRCSSDKPALQGQVSRCSDAEPPGGFSVAVMVHFMRQLGWATGSPDVWPHVIRDASVRFGGWE